MDRRSGTGAWRTWVPLSAAVIVLACAVIVTAGCTDAPAGLPGAGTGKITRSASFMKAVANATLADGTEILDYDDAAHTRLAVFPNRTNIFFNADFCTVTAADSSARRCTPAERDFVQRQTTEPIHNLF